MLMAQLSMQHVLKAHAVIHMFAASLPLPHMIRPVGRLKHVNNLLLLYTGHGQQWHQTHRGGDSEGEERRTRYVLWGVYGVTRQASAATTLTLPNTDAPGLLSLGIVW